jgi:hypothetical protein
MQATAQQPTLQANAQQQAEQEMMFNIIANLSQSQSQSGLFGAAQVDDSAAPNFGGTATRGDLQSQYQADPHLQNTFGSFDNYIAYMTEASPMLGGLDWWNDTGIDKRTQAGIQREGDDLAITTAPPVNDLRQSNYNARQSGYNTWLNSAENQAFMQKYGIEPVIVDEKGDTYTWTGNGYMRTDINEDSRLGANDVIKAGIVASLGAGLAGAAAPALGGSLGLGAAGTGAVKGAGGALISGLIQGDGLDPKSILLGAATGGLGGALSNTNGMLGGFINTGSDIADDAIKGALTGAIGGAVDGDILEGALYGAAGGAATNLIGKGYNKLIGGGGDTSEWDFASGPGWDEDDLLNMDLSADDYLNSPLFVGPNASLAGYDPDRAIPFDDPRFDPTLDINNDGVLDADDLQTIDTSHLQTYEQNLLQDQGYVKPNFSTKGRYYLDPETGTIYSSKDITYGDFNGETTMFVNGQPVGWMDQVSYTSGGNFVLTNDPSKVVSYDSVYNPDTNEIQFLDNGMEEIVNGADGTVMGTDLVGAPNQNLNPGDYVNSDGENVRYLGTIYGQVDDNGNWSPGSPGVEDAIYWNEDQQEYVTKGGVVVNMDTVPEDQRVIEEVETTDSSPESTPTNSTDKTEKGGSSNAGNDGTPSQDVGPSNPTLPSDYVLVGVNSNGERVYENVITNIRVPESELPGEVYAGEPEGDPEVETEPTTNQEEGATGTSDTAEQGGGQNAEQDNGRGGTDSGDDAGDGNSDGNDLGEEGENDGIGDDDDEGKGADDEGSGDPGIGDGTGGSGGGGLGEGLLAGLGGGGSDENYVWQPIAGLTRISPYQKRRHAIYNSLNEGLLKAALQEGRRA